MTRTLSLILCGALCIGSAAALSAAAEEYPTPSVYPVSWQFDFSNRMPKRIVVDSGKGAVAYWYLPYTVTNNTDKERLFVPVFEMVTNEGKIVRSDKDIPLKVFAAIRKQEGNKLLEPVNAVSGEIRLGESEARDSVAIWREPAARMGSFSVFVSGLSGEAIIMKDDKGEVKKDAEGNPVILRKTLQLNFHINGDEVYPGEDEVHTKGEEWVMR
jgi:hypothetical protein